MIKIQSFRSDGRHRLIESLAQQSDIGAEVATTTPEQLLNDPAWRLFELDFERHAAVYLNVGSAFDPAGVAFCYQAMARQAKEVAYVDLDLFLAFATQRKSPSRRIIQFYNIGHCGSTLVHNAINASGDARCISEPKFLWSIAMNRNTVSRARLVALAKACFALIDSPAEDHASLPLVVKHFSQSTKVYDIWQAATPDAVSLYLYRDAVAWCNSLYGFVQRVGLPAAMPRDRRSFNWYMMSGHEPEGYLEGLVDLNAEQLDHWELFACAWGLHMQEFLAARDRGLKAFAFRYNELMENREAVLRTLFEYCGLDDGQVVRGLSAFDHDAHAGEDTAHDTAVEKLTLEAGQRVADIVRLPKLGFEPNMTI